MPLAIALAAALLGACTQEVAWPKAAGDTSCREWTAEMRPAQRSALGQTILLTLRANDNVSRPPTGPLVEAYVRSIGDVCATTPDEKVSSVAATIYTLSDDLKQ